MLVRGGGWGRNRFGLEGGGKGASVPREHLMFKNRLCNKIPSVSPGKKKVGTTTKKKKRQKKKKKKKPTKKKRKRRNEKKKKR